MNSSIHQLLSFTPTMTLRDKRLCDDKGSADVIVFLRAEKNGYAQK